MSNLRHVLYGTFFEEDNFLSINLLFFPLITSLKANWDFESSIKPHYVVDNSASRVPSFDMLYVFMKRNFWHAEHPNRSFR